MNSHKHPVKNAEALLEERVEPEWVDYPTAERFSSLSHTTLWRYVSSGELKAARVGRSVRIHLPNLNPLVAMVLAAALLGEHLTIIFVAGFGAVLMGVLLVNWPKRTQAASAERSR
jgi:hypothetical protein